MRVLNMKLISIVIILVFCLTPLSAIDLNQSNHVAVEDNGNSTDIEINDTDITNGNEIETKNLNETKNISQKEISDDQEELVDPNLSIEIDDAAYGEETYLTIHSNESLDAYVIIKSTSGYGPHNYKMKGGYARVKIPSNYQKRGTHKFEVLFFGNKVFKASSAETYLTVPGVDPNIDIEVQKGFQSVTAWVHANKTLKTTLQVQFSNSKDYVTVPIYNGEAHVSSFISEPGNYTVNVFYNGNDTFCPANITVPFEFIPED